ncbi:M56 family metallopeptidase [Bacteroides intestinalis]|jgi:TonB family protein|uniref:M56 family peptidase n=1 Tax=Bacteroides intestinalis TaxID=329854 RepID=A0AAQ0LLR5_9BACE|nr:M56 family metallopeptidase [Bacteroides intestinalis]QDO67625.1 M56 family metallopeptidase [Bacteroides intestinalis]RGT47348.1 M56 family peptidase [Bacteroides intestinalis]RGX82711.1 M56 family peptidase [Bacteroides intestinalis]UCB35856.1 M56 family metallopeptidase [Bacteroides intestinalis]UCB40098.1 M56 family metallopeptidase [Bacteroides intestinalis]
MLAYFLKINVAIALFYAFYRLFFYKDTFFTWRRVALLCFFAVSAVYPLLNIQTWITEQEPMVAMADLYADIVLPEFTLTPEKATFDWKAILLQTAGFVYWGGVALLAARFLMQLAGIIRLAFRSRKTKIGDTNVHLLKQADGPFSFFHWIFVHPASHTEEELSEILTHEQAHANQWHSIDVLISEAACVLCWFNPFAWLMKREIRTNLEYLADNRVLETGHDSKSYQYHLLGLSHYKAAATIYNSFNVLPLKKRIKMMNKKRTREIGRTKYLMFLPLAALLMIISNIEAVARTTKEMAKEVIEAVEENLTSDTTAPDMEVSTEPTPAETPMPQQNKDKLVNYKGVVVDKDGKAVEGAEFFIDGDHRLPQGQSYVTGKNGSFSFKAFENAKMIVIWKKDGKMMGVPVTVNKEDNSNMKIIMNRKWQNPPADDPDNPVFEVVEVMPEFPDGGMPGLMNFLSNNIKYPVNAQKRGVQGRVSVQFIVNADGSISDVGIIRAVDPDLDGEAVRVISTMPKWKPGTQRGKPVRVKYTVPVMFRLPDEDKKEEYKPVPKIEETVVVGYGTRQESPVEEGQVFEVVEQMPSFPGGPEGLMRYISKNIKYPVGAQKAGTQGRVMIEVIIDTNGNVTNPKVSQGVDPLLDAEAIRVTSNMPKWQPGTQRGQAVNVKYTFPIIFRLQ